MPIALSIAFTPTPLALGEKIVIDATGQVSAGISFMPRSKYKTIFVGAAASASPANLLIPWNNIFGALIAGRKIFFRAKVVSATGIPSALILTSVVVT